MAQFCVGSYTLCGSAGNFPVDSRGCLHTCAYFGKRCRVESWFVNTARHAVRAASSTADGDAKISVLWCNYTYESTEEARQATVARQRALPPLSFDMALSQYLSGILSIAPFMTPFFYLLLLSTDVAGPRRVEAEFELQQCLHTSWGGGLLVNSLLFGGRKIVASSQADVQITKAGCTVPSTMDALTPSLPFYCSIPSSVKRSWTVEHQQSARGCPRKRLTGTSNRALKPQR